MMGTLIVSSLIAIAAAVAGIEWFSFRILRARNDRLTARLTRTEGERDAARRAWTAAEAENTALRARNAMLTDLVGEEVPSWPTPPA